MYGGDQVNHPGARPPLAAGGAGRSVAMSYQDGVLARLPCHLARRLPTRCWMTVKPDRSAHQLATGSSAFMRAGGASASNGYSTRPSSANCARTRCQTRIVDRSDGRKVVCWCDGHRLTRMRRLMHDDACRQQGPAHHDGMHRSVTHVRSHAGLSCAAV